MNCELCGEAIPPFETIRSERFHRECQLREVSGGIGHHIAHPYWCLQMHDPDGGLTRRQSALLVDEYIALVGVEVATRRWPT